MITQRADKVALGERAEVDDGVRNPRLSENQRAQADDEHDEQRLHLARSDRCTSPIPVLC